MVPIDHATLHARDFGGKPEDYLPVDRFLDSTKLHCADYRHRAILHSSFGIDLAEQVFGDSIINSDGARIPVREIARRHIMQDCSCVPTVKEWLDALCTGQAQKFNRPDKRELAWLNKHVYKKDVPDGMEAVAT